ncbi:MAG TPA: glycosyltransferase [Thermoleophilaceae bacterium]
MSSEPSVVGDVSDMPAPQGAKVSGRDIVCVGTAEWDAELRTNQHHLMARLARDNNVLFIESLGLRQPSISSHDLRRIVKRLRSGVKPPRAVDGLHVLSPLVIPMHKYAAVRAVNRRLLPWLVQRAAKKLGMSNPVLWAYNPQAEVLIDALEPSTLVYHCVDNVGVQRGIDSVSFGDAERRFAGAANMVFASSAPLAQRMSEISDRVFAMPNVADTERFAHALEDGTTDPAMAALPHPRIVFVGALVGKKLDLSLLVGLARERPDWSFAFVGPVGLGDTSTNLRELRAQPNVHLLGSRTHNELPDVLRGADAGLIPYALNELTQGIFPMKVYEYLAAGLPVVATPIPSLEGVEGIDTAPDAKSTAAKLDELLAGDSPEERRERSRLALGHSWETRLEEIGAAFELHG